MAKKIKTKFVFPKRTIEFEGRLDFRDTWQDNFKLKGYPDFFCFFDKKTNYIKGRIKGKAFKIHRGDRNSRDFYPIFAKFLNELLDNI